MNFNFNLMCTSNYIRSHPMLEEDVKYKIRYLNVLQYFIEKYSIENEFAIQSLENYKSIFLNEYLVDYSYTKKSLNELVKGSKIFKYRYVLLSDCLFINAMLDKAKAIDILNEIKSIYNSKYHQKIDIVFGILYNNKKSMGGVKQIKNEVKLWNLNKKHLEKKQVTILTTATMSAGKSTLINTLIGKTVNRTMNDACTSKLHYIYNKAFEDGFNYKLDHTLNLDVSQRGLLTNDSNSDDSIHISTYFQMLSNKENRLCIIDTPGVNSYLNLDHSEITKEVILKNKYDKVLYVFNCQHLGSNDDLEHLKFICKNVDSKKLVFVLNKLDKFRLPEDSIEESMDNLKEDLIKLGVNNPIICPVSSYAGSLIKKKIFEMDLNEDEEDDYLFILSKFRKSEYNLSKFYPEHILHRIDEKYKGKEKKHLINLLINCGILCLEEIITEGDTN